MYMAGAPILRYFISFLKHLNYKLGSFEGGTL